MSQRTAALDYLLLSTECPAVQEPNVVVSSTKKKKKQAKRETENQSDSSRH